MIDADRRLVEPLLEIRTTPCEMMAELRNKLFTRIANVLRAADDLDTVCYFVRRIDDFQDELDAPF